MARYRYRPLPVEAFQFVIGPNEVFDQLCDRLADFVGQNIEVYSAGSDGYALINDDYGACEVRVGSWVVKDGPGIAVYEHDAFMELFEPVV